jgi:hypothetical protein
MLCVAHNDKKMDVFDHLLYCDDNGDAIIFLNKLGVTKEDVVNGECRAVCHALAYGKLARAQAYYDCYSLTQDDFKTYPFYKNPLYHACISNNKEAMDWAYNLMANRLSRQPSAPFYVCLVQKTKGKRECHQWLSKHLNVPVCSIEMGAKTKGCCVG